MAFKDMNYNTEALFETGDIPLLNSLEKLAKNSINHKSNKITA